MSNRVFIATLLVTAGACSGASLGVPSSPAEPTSSPSNPEPITPSQPTPQPTPQPAPTPQPTAGYCASDGSFDFDASATGLSAYEGRQIFVAALENHYDSATKTQAQRAPVRLAGVITSGVFALACPSALKDTSYYPSWGVFIDMNGDGLCGPGDVGAQNLFYAWNQAVSVDLTPGQQAAGELFPVEQLAAPIGPTTDFCTGFFPAP